MKRHGERYESGGKYHLSGLVILLVSFAASVYVIIKIVERVTG